VQEIEAHFRGDAGPTAPHQISAAWTTRWHATPWTEAVRIAFWPHVALPHAAVTGAGLGLFALQRAGVLTL
jgi:hypothetical protein